MHNITKKAMIFLKNCFINIFFLSKANGDLQQFWNYQRSHSSIINISSFPIALHLTNHPETLEYLYSCSDALDNLNFNKVGNLRESFFMSYTV